MAVTNRLEMSDHYSANANLRCAVCFCSEADRETENGVGEEQAERSRRQQAEVTYVTPTGSTTNKEDKTSEKLKNDGEPSTKKIRAKM
ncbi:hypothetical protein INR49_016521 [Caranx melampygus]|nr:hypothetical protein INR49_016521 [Caranx melampygus]